MTEKMKNGKKLTLTLWHILSGIFFITTVISGTLLLIIEKPKPAGAVETSAQELRMLGLPHKALQEYESYLSQKGIPTRLRANMHYLAGMLCLEELGDAQEAIRHFEAAAALVKHNVLARDVQEKLVEALEYAGQYEASTLLIEQMTVIGGPLENADAILLRYKNNDIELTWTVRDFMLWFIISDDGDHMWYDLSSEQKEQYLNRFAFEMYWFAQSRVQGVDLFFRQSYRIAEQSSAARYFYDSAFPESSFDEVFLTFHSADAIGMTRYDVIE